MTWFELLCFHFQGQTSNPFSSLYTQLWAKIFLHKLVHNIPQKMDMFSAVPIHLWTYKLIKFTSSKPQHRQGSHLGLDLLRLSKMKVFTDGRSKCGMSKSLDNEKISSPFCCAKIFLAGKWMCLQTWTGNSIPFLSDYSVDSLQIERQEISRTRHSFQVLIITQWILITQCRDSHYSVAMIPTRRNSRRSRGIHAVCQGHGVSLQSASAYDRESVMQDISFQIT